MRTKPLNLLFLSLVLFQIVGCQRRLWLVEPTQTNSMSGDGWERVIRECPGKPVRAKVAGDQLLEGICLEADREWLVLGFKGGSRRLAKAEVVEVQLRAPSPRLKGGLIGAGIGSSIFLILAAAFEGDERGSMLLVAPIAGGIGALVGALSAGEETWKTVYRR